MDEKVQSANVALSHSLMFQMMQGTKLDLVQIVEGYWKDHISESQHNDFQDIVVFRKTRLSDLEQPVHLPANLL